MNQRTANLLDALQECVNSLKLGIFRPDAQPLIARAETLIAEEQQRSAAPTGVKEIVFKVDDKPVIIGGDFRAEVDLGDGRSILVVVNYEGIITDCFGGSENIATSSITFEERWVSLVEDQHGPVE